MKIKLDQSMLHWHALYKEFIPFVRKLLRIYDMMYQLICQIYEVSCSLQSIV